MHNYCVYRNYFVREKVGKTVSSKDEMIKALKILLENQQEYEDCQLHAKSYFDNNHRIEVIGARYEKLFKGL